MANTRRRNIVVTTWSAVFPLSGGPEETVRRAMASRDRAGVDDAVRAYIGAINSRLPRGLTLRRDGSVIGVGTPKADSRNRLFRAVFETDLELILDRHVRERRGDDCG